MLAFDSLVTSQSRLKANQHPFTDGLSHQYMLILDSTATSQILRLSLGNQLCLPYLQFKFLLIASSPKRSNSNDHDVAAFVPTSSTATVPSTSNLPTIFRPTSFHSESTSQLQQRCHLQLPVLNLCLYPDPQARTWGTIPKRRHIWVSMLLSSSPPFISVPRHDLISSAMIIDNFKSIYFFVVFAAFLFRAFGVAYFVINFCLIFLVPYFFFSCLILGLNLYVHVLHLPLSSNSI